jgi:orotate phosphoribosyltransferase
MAMFKTGRLSLRLGSFFAGMMVGRGLVDKTDVILGPSYKGSALALAASIALWQEYGRDLLYDYDRKEAKTHGEASRSKNLFVNATFFDGCRVFVVDDVATSMGTKYDLIEKIRGEAGARGMRIEVTGIGIGIDREQTTAVYDKNGKVVPDKKGRDAIRDFEENSGIPVYAVAGIREVVVYLDEARIPVVIRGDRRPIDRETRAVFDRYLDTYGAGRAPSS